MKIEIVYALPDKAHIMHYQIDDTITVEQALTQSQFCQKYQIDLSQHQVGIYGKKVMLTQTLSDGDRIEIYRALLADPKEIRRRRAKQTKVS